MKTLIASLLMAPLLSHAACESVSVTVLPFEGRIDYSLPAAEIPGGRNVGAVSVKYHIAVEGCSVTLGYADPVLYVARELNGNPCALAHVLRHEKEHVRIYRRALETLADRVKARRGEDSLFQVAKEELEAVQVLHRGHDNHREYRLNFTACNGAIASLAGL
jgi:hypothetical protein